MNFYSIATVVITLFFAGVAAMLRTAIDSTSLTLIEDKADDGNKAAKRLVNVIKKPAPAVNAFVFLQLALTVLATILATETLVTESNRGISVFWVVILLTFVGYVFIGVAPSTLGRQHAEKITLRLARPIALMGQIFSPLTTVLIMIGNAITPGKGFRQGPFASTSHLRDLLDIAEADQVIEDDEAQMLHSVFDLGETHVREVMVPRTEMVWIERDKTLRQAISLALRSGFSRIPVIGEDGDDVVGVVYVKDLIKRIFEHRESESSERVESLMRAPYFVPDSKLVDELLKELQVARVHLAIAVDEYGGTAGIITIEDILEEIVGEISDEFDRDAPEVVQLNDDSYRVSSRMNIEDFTNLIDLHLANEDEEAVDTVAGLMALKLERVAIPGSVVVIDGWRLTAESGVGRRNRVATVLAEREISAEGEADEDQ
jgi:CBS domain containing-hemolysin-like protein